MASKLQNANPDKSGLYLFGKITSRQRRSFDKKEGGKRYNITLHVLTESGLFKPERWSDIPMPQDVPAVNDDVELPVTLTTYNTKGGTGFRLNWGPANESEAF